EHLDDRVDSLSGFDSRQGGNLANGQLSVADEDSPQKNVYFTIT
ncbi:MAG: hypothetical protein HW376_1259, partial [candidate division NC10 bacterium]|nr:hypothetical protein [candidate division NC10 bacterium]